MLAWPAFDQGKRCERRNVPRQVRFALRLVACLPLLAPSLRTNLFAQSPPRQPRHAEIRNASTLAEQPLPIATPPVNPKSPSRFELSGLPADITPLLSIAGIWQPVADAFIDQATPSYGAGALGNKFFGNVPLPNGREGIVATGWVYSGFNNPARSITPVTIALLEQQANGLLQLATSKYVSDPQTNGGGGVLIADFNGDGAQDIFLPAHNESPALPASSTAYLSTSNGTYSKVTIADSVEAHGSTVADVSGRPVVFTAGYYIGQGFADTATYFDKAKGLFSVVPDLHLGANSSVAVADFYGTGTFSAVYGDVTYGPGHSFDPNGIWGIYLWHLTDLVPSGPPTDVGNPYFNRPQFAQYPSFQDPHGKQHNYRIFIDDFNHDGMADIIVQGQVWDDKQYGQQKSVLQMFQNVGNYRFRDVTDHLGADYDQDSEQDEYMAQVRDIDGSGIASYLFGSPTFDDVKAAGNYVIVNDGSGSLHVALHETLNAYSEQLYAWLTANQSTLLPGVYLSAHWPAVRVRAYQTPDGRLNFVAVLPLTRISNPSLPLWVNVLVFVNLPLRIDLSSQYRKPMIVRDRNGSRRIRTFAGDDIIYSGNSGGTCTVDGGLGVNTVVYTGPARNYSTTRNPDGSWTVRDNVGRDGTDVLIRVQKLQFTDSLVTLN